MMMFPVIHCHGPLSHLQSGKKKDHRIGLEIIRIDDLRNSGHFRCSFSHYLWALFCFSAQQCGSFTLQLCGFSHPNSIMICEFVASLNCFLVQLMFVLLNVSIACLLPLSPNLIARGVLVPFYPCIIFCCL